MADAVYRALVRDLFTTRLPTVIMALLFAAVSITVLTRVDDPVLAVLATVGVLANLARIAAVFAGKRMMATEPMQAHIRATERRVAILYYVFAAIVGAFAARVLQVAPFDLGMLSITMAVGYAAGVTSCAASRPRISLACLALAILPPAAMCLLTPNAAHHMTGLAILGFLGGGVRSILKRHRASVAEVTMRHRYAALARQDGLTNLPNRLALGERFDALASAGGGHDMLAVHCLDLDRFKPINDRLGHPVGDAVLMHVGEGLAALATGGGIAARLGGDEFVLVQVGIADAAAAERMSALIETRLSGPAIVAGHRVEIGVSVGHCVAPRSGASLEAMLKIADDVLLARKRQRVVPAHMAETAASQARRRA